MTETELRELAATGLRAEITRLQSLLAEVTSNTGRRAATATPKRAGERRRMSAAGRKAISDAAKARWKAVKAAGQTSLGGFKAGKKR